MRRILQPVRFVGILLLVVTYLSHMALVRLVVRRRWRQVKVCNRLLSFYSHIGLFIFAVKVNPIGLEHRHAQPSALYVGNHHSYVDVLVISIYVAAGFVTSVEVRDTPFLGLICKMSGCLFVERRNRANLRGEVNELSEGLKYGLNVAIFPEGTSTNGEQMLRFRRPLFLSAVDAGVPVVPVCQNYRTVGGQPINKVSRDSIMWYGDMDFAPHLWALCGSGGVTVDLHFLPPIQTASGDDPALLAERAQAAVESVFSPVK